MKRITSILLGLIGFVLSIIGFFYFTPMLAATGAIAPEMSPEFIEKSDEMVNRGLYGTIFCLVMFFISLAVLVHGIKQKKK